MDKISVIMCAFNAQTTIEKAIVSVIGQKLSDESGKQIFDFELIVIDDGSTDDTLSIIDKYAEKDQRIKVHHQENHGLSYSREKAMEFVSGDYIAFCDSDDWVEPDWLKSMYSYAKKYDADIVRFRALIDGIKTEYNPNEVLVWDKMETIRQFFIHKKINAMLQMELIRKEIFKGVHFDVALRNWEDQSVALKLINNSNRVVRVNDAKYHYFVNEFGISNGKPNYKRVRDSIDVMNGHVDFCMNAPYDKFLEQAIMFRNNWILSELISMIKCGLKEFALAKEIQHIFRQNPILTIKSAIGIGRKLCAISVMINLTFSRVIIATLYSVAK